MREAAACVIGELPFRELEPDFILLPFVFFVLVTATIVVI